MKITKIRFFEYGKDAPKNSRYKGKISNETISGYFDYTSRDEAKDDAKVIEQQDDGYFGYTSSHSAGTYSSSGALETEEERQCFKKEIHKYFCHQAHICWDYVISIEDDHEAYDLELETGEQWRAVMQDVLPKIFKQYDLDYHNVLWWFDVHRNTKHPHIHLAFMEKKQTRNRGKLSQRKMKNVKQIIYTSLAARKRLKEKTGQDYKDYFKDKDFVFKELMTTIKKVNLNQNMNINDLYRILPKTGRLQYNSQNMKLYQPIIQSIIDDMIQNDSELKKVFDSYILKIDMLESVMKEQDDGISSIREAELKKFYERAGNYILQNYKKNQSVNTHTDNWAFDRYNHKQSLRTKKYLTEYKMKSYLFKTANEQQREIDKAIEEFNRRMENQLLNAKDMS